MPWWNASHGPSPSPASAISAIPEPEADQTGQEHRQPTHDRPRDPALAHPGMVGDGRAVGGGTLRAMHLHFLGAATTVTGSQFLLTTERARILIDCGMFQGSPNESIRNRIPLAYDPAAIDAILLTHAHLDHCGLIPHVVKEGFDGPIWATQRDGRAGPPRPARLGQAPGGVRQARARWERRHPDEAAAEDARDLAA